MGCIETVGFLNCVITLHENNKNKNRVPCDRVWLKYYPTSVVFTSQFFLRTLHLLILSICLTVDH